jgi:hypothetical protein
MVLIEAAKDSSLDESTTEHETKGSVGFFLVNSLDDYNSSLHTDCRSPNST